MAIAATVVGGAMLGDGPRPPVERPRDGGDGGDAGGGGVATRRHRPPAPPTCERPTAGRGATELPVRGGSAGA